jgi:uncharacterized protein YjbJ (UPF0337 family)
MKSSDRQKGEGSWKQLKGRMQEAWGALTDDDVDRYEGNREQLTGYLQQKTGQTRDAISRKLDEWSRDLKYGWSSRSSKHREL